MSAARITLYLAAAYLAMEALEAVQDAIIAASKGEWLSAAIRLAVTSGLVFMTLRVWQAAR